MFPLFADPELQNEFNKDAPLMKIPEGHILMEPGETIQFMPILKSGCLRILRKNEEGKEAFLYHIMPGETCAMSLTCCSTRSLSEIKAIAEEDTELFTIPISKMEEWQKYKEWRNFIAFAYKTRFDRLLQTIDDLAFENMDERLLSYLEARAKAKGSSVLNINHEEIGQELNIQRESATRLLKKLKELGYIDTSRGQVTLLKNKINLVG